MDVAATPAEGAGPRLRAWRVVGAGDQRQLVIDLEEQAAGDLQVTLVAPPDVRERSEAL